ncbi:glycosyltransferase family 2 protein [Pelomonas aquatica]|nr:glycosyltransferase family 2 protein [Pelomonas aquatica]
MKISLITIVRNAERHIDRTIRSILAQNYPELEYIVIDGASTDSTVARIRAYEERITRIISEPDKGISDAWNKGLKLATGEVVGLLNAGDEYGDDVLSSVSRFFTNHGSVGVVFGDTTLVSEDGAALITNRGRFHPWRYSGGLGFYHPSLFAQRRVYESIGGFDTGLKYAMDADWIFRAKRAGVRLAHNDHLVRMLDDGVSVKARFKAYGEYLQCLAAPGNPKSWPYLSMMSTGLRGLAKAALAR